MEIEWGGGERKKYSGNFAPRKFRKFVEIFWKFRKFMEIFLTVLVKFQYRTVILFQL